MVSPPVEEPAAWVSTSAGSLAGIVVDEAGEGVPDAWVTSWPGGLDTHTDEQGVFQLSRLLPRNTAILVAADGFVEQLSEEALIVADEEAWIEVQLVSTATEQGGLSVWVEDPNGEPVAGLEVEVDGEISLTDEQGFTYVSGLGGLNVEVTVSDPTGRLHPATRSLEIPRVGGEQLSFRLSGQPDPDSWTAGSTLCAFCHTDVAQDHAGSAHASAISELATVPWVISPTALGQYGGPHRGAVPFDAQGPLSIAWTPMDPERGAWSGAAGGEHPWTPPAADSPEGECQSCHSTAPDEGVGCEGCHGPGGGHASGPLKDKATTILNPALLEEEDANAVCANCHSAPNFLAWPSGAAAVPGAQSDELESNAHGQCADCHDPHTGELYAPKEDNSLCLSCHEGLDFPDEQAVIEHTGHPVYAPDGLVASNRCTGCHMPETTARLAWSPEAGAGDLSSHLFVALPPSETLAAFDDAGVDTLEPWAYPANACVACHSWNAWLFDGAFPGPSGDPAERATHEAYQQSYEELWP